MKEHTFKTAGLNVDLNAKTAIITGAAGGIGTAIAGAVFDAGARVFAVDRSEIKRQNVPKKEGTFICHVADVRHTSSVDNMINKCLSDIGPPDILINMAAISVPCPVKEMTLENWNQHMEANLTSVFLCTQAVLPSMIKRRKGCIINFSSMIARTGGETSAHYSAAKSGIEGFSRSLAREVGPSGIRINVIAPGMIDTPMLELMPQAQLEKLTRRIPLRRIGNPRDTIGITLLLASDAGGYITGQTIHINGGLYMS
ncbi:MAG: 3-oxoacyl-ACP reductase family protein [Desulfobacterales bacterium]